MLGYIQTCFHHTYSVINIKKQRLEVLEASQKPSQNFLKASYQKHCKMNIPEISVA